MMFDDVPPAPRRIYVASSWRNDVQPVVVERLRAGGHEVYDFKNPPGGTGFSWREVKTPGVESAPHSRACGIRRHEHGIECHVNCPTCHGRRVGIKAKGSDWEIAAEYLRMVAHPRALEGFASDFDAMQWADTFVMVLPCGKSAHLELGWAVGAGKQTIILLEDPVEPELMYRMVDVMVPTIDELIELLVDPVPA